MGGGWVPAVGIVSALVAVIGTYLKMRPRMAEVQLQGQAALWSRIGALEAQQKAERDECDMRIERVEAELTKLRVENGAVMIVTLDVTLALKKKDPASPALKRAAATLRKAFPLNAEDNPALQDLLEQIETKYGDDRA